MFISTVDAAGDLSWCEDARETARRAKDAGVVRDLLALSIPPSRVPSRAPSLAPDRGAPTAAQESTTLIDDGGEGVSLASDRDAASTAKRPGVDRGEGGDTAERSTTRSVDSGVGVTAASSGVATVEEVPDGRGGMVAPEDGGVRGGERAQATPQAPSPVDQRFVPMSAVLSVGELAFSCTDDMGEGAIDSGYGSARLGVLEIFVGSCSSGIGGSSRGGSGLASSTMQRAMAMEKEVSEGGVMPIPSGGASDAEEGWEGNAATVIWNTVTAAGDSEASTLTANKPSPPSKIEQDPGVMTTAKAEMHGAAGLVPMGATASARIGEVRIACYPTEACAAGVGATVHEATADDLVQRSVHSVVVRGISASPTIVVQRQQQEGEDQPGSEDQMQKQQQANQQRKQQEGQQQQKQQEEGEKGGEKEQQQQQQQEEENQRRKQLEIHQQQQQQQQQQPAEQSAPGQEASSLPSPPAPGTLSILIPTDEDDGLQSSSDILCGDNDNNNAGDSPPRPLDSDNRGAPPLKSPSVSPPQSPSTSPSERPSKDASRSPSKDPSQSPPGSSPRRRRVVSQGLPPPPLPPRRPHAQTEFYGGFDAKVPEVVVHVESVAGSIDAGLAGWLNLRGRWEAEDMSEKAERTKRLISGERELGALILIFTFCLVD